ncbi:MAG: hypothetical protein EBU81_06515, partial [Proteobacteria bacterium]|nr:hypothetical protein [Pseudomonadota bacterium]
MARIVGSETADLDIVAQQIGPPADRIIRPGEELLLVVEARAPGEIGPDLQVLAQHMAHHVHGVDSLGGFFIVGAAGGMDVVVARDPTLGGGIDPPLHLEAPAVGPASGHLEFPALHHRLGAPGELHRIPAGGQAERFAVAAIDLGMEEEVGGQPLRLGGEHMTPGVGDQQRAGGGLAVLVEHLE